MTEKTYTLTINLTYDVKLEEQEEKIKNRLDVLPMAVAGGGMFDRSIPATLVTYDHQVEDNPKLIKRVLDVSMVHVPEWYRELDVRMPYKLADHGFGFFCWVPYEDYADAPFFMEPFIELAHSKGCAFINFDNEGQVIAGLPTYDEKAEAPDATVWIGPERSPIAAITACNNGGEYMDPLDLAEAAFHALIGEEAKESMCVDTFCANMAERTHFVAQLRDGGWFATYDGPKKG